MEENEEDNAQGVGEQETELMGMMRMLLEEQRLADTRLEGKRP